MLVGGEGETQSDGGRLQLVGALVAVTRATCLRNTGDETYRAGATVLQAASFRLRNGHSVIPSSCRRPAADQRRTHSRHSPISRLHGHVYALPASNSV